MNFTIKNSFIVSKKIKQIIKRNLLKSPVINYFGDNHPKNVLISYITKPFRKGIDITHTSSAEVLEIAKIFRSLGYNVDAADYDYDGFIDYSKYSVVFGFGEPLINSFYSNLQNRLVRIYYGTGMHISVQNNNSLKRIGEVYNKKGVWLLDSGRIVEKAWAPQTNIVDAMILLGNEEVSETYKRFFNKDIFLIPPSYYNLYDYKEIIEVKNFTKAKRNFLWFGSSGLIHKGLDLILEVFKNLPTLQLHVCGPIDDEPGFKTAYHNELYDTSNIHTHGFVKIDSPLFERLLKECAFVVYPSCSEGGGVSILNAIGNGGLIPILSKEASIDIDDFGISIENISSEAVQNAIEKALMLPVEEIKTRSSKAGEKINTINSIDNYRNLLKTNLNRILRSHEM